MHYSSNEPIQKIKDKESGKTRNSMYLSMDERVINTKPKNNKARCELKQEIKMYNDNTNQNIGAAEMSSFITESTGENARYGITLQSKHTRNDNMNMNDQINQYRKWEKAEIDKVFKRIDHQMFERKKVELKTEMLRLQQNIKSIVTSAQDRYTKLDFDVSQ